MLKWILFKVLIPVAIIALILLVIQLVDPRLTVLDDLGSILKALAWQFWWDLAHGQVANPPSRPPH